jgi:subtilisin family serine protease
MLRRSPLAAALLTAIAAGSYAQNADAPQDDAQPFDVQAATQAARSTGSTLAKAAASAAELRARSYQTFMAQINKPFANQLAAGNGAGVLVGVVDSGVQVSHPALRGQVIATYNAFTGGTDVTDHMGHGTHVAGLVAGSLAQGALLEGIAPGAKLAVAKVFTTGGSDSTTIGRGIDWAVNVRKAPIVTLSLGSNAAAMQGNIQNAVNRGTLITAALGNEGRASGSWPAAFAKQGWAKGQIIAVGALDASNRRASFSNYDATLANWTVFAPGVNVASSYSTPSMPGSYVYMSGTSMATPIVAGQAALIKSNWNFLAAADIAQIIFQSATRLCSDNASTATCRARTTADAVYGWGLVNVGASLQPIGSLNLGTRSGATITFAGASLASPKSGLSAGLKTVNTLAVDKFNRGFVVDVSAGVGTTPSSISALPVTSKATSTSSGARLTAQYVPTASEQTLMGLASEDAPLTLARWSFAAPAKGGFSWGVGAGSSTDEFFGLQATGSAPLSLSEEGGHFNTPYLRLPAHGSHAGTAWTLSGRDVLRVGTVVQGNPLNPIPAELGASTGVQRRLALVEYQSHWGGVTTVVSAGQLAESNSVLGSSGNEALALQGESRTRFISVAASSPLAGNTSLSGMVTLGEADAFQNRAASLIDGTTAVRQLAWSVGLQQDSVWRTGDRLGWTVSMPLRTMSGAVQITTAVEQSQEDGSLRYEQQSLGLAPTGMQKDFTVSYQRPHSKGSVLAGHAYLRLESGHDASAPPQVGVGLRYQRAF